MDIIKSNTALISSFDLWVKLNQFRKEENSSAIRHGDFLARVIDEIDDLGVCETFVHPQNKKDVSFYNLTHNQALLVGMRESKIVRKKVLEWINTLTAPQIPQTYAEALQLAADQAKQLELAAPKVEFYDRVAERDTLMNASQVAQKHNLSAVRLNKFLDELGVYSHAIKRARVFQQWFIDQGLGKLRQTELGFSQAMFTPSGEMWICEKLVTEGAI